MLGKASLKNSYLGLKNELGPVIRKQGKGVVYIKRIAHSKALRWKEFGLFEDLKEG